MNLQTSTKSGVKSTAKKMEYSRHGFDPHPATHQVPGATGKQREKNVAPEGDKHSEIQQEVDKIEF